MSDPTQPLLAQKQTLRQQTLLRRRQQPDKDRLSQAIGDTLRARPEYRRATAVMSYVGVRDEVRTLPALEAILAEGKTLAVPYCDGDRLGLFRLEDLGELVEGYFGLLEPPAELRGRSDRQLEVARLNLVLVPGVAFDRQGGRLGHGRGYYDRLLAQLPQETVTVGLAFECQLVPTVPTMAHDVALDLVITEQAVYRGRGRAG